MSDPNSNPASALVDAAFHSMEEVTEVARVAGWLGEYHQLGKGAVTSQWRSLHLGESSLISHQLDNHVHVRIAPPKGCVALVIVPPSYQHLLVEGSEFGSNQVLVTDTETEFLVPGLARCETLVLPKLEFEKSAHALFPDMSTNGGPFHLIDGPPSKWSVLQVGFQNLLSRGDISEEDLSQLLCRFLDLMADQTEKRSLENGSSIDVARLAQEYIENHYANPIRMEDLCGYTGSSLRTLQRSFLKYFQLSPYEYITARRLNSARQALVAGDPSRDSITRIALDNGFTHLGRFSVNYRKHFNESPKETLERRYSGVQVLGWVK